ncbi:MAG: HAD family phosphatase [Nocardioides sp.]|uniref:HAD family hydrolase n=1 Tax=Nocardioides sp. TaxID=35761 RepID=UPI0039E30D66
MSHGSPTTLPAAVLWDMDGTLCDTEPWWIQTEYALAERFGTTWTREDALALVGNDLLTSGAYIRDRWGLDLSPRQVVDLLHDGVVARVRDGEVPWQPGAVELLAALNAAGVPCALVTMSWEVFALPIVERLPRGRFDAIVTGDRVARGKPFPDPYLAGAAALGVDAAQCVAIEDSNTGAASAEAAGCTVLTIENHVPLEAGPRRIARPTLAGLTPADLGSLLLPAESS